MIKKKLESLNNNRDSTNTKSCYLLQKSINFIKTNGIITTQTGQCEILLVNR
jgi:hypothetical protein